MIGSIRAKTASSVIARSLTCDNLQDMQDRQADPVMDQKDHRSPPVCAISVSHPQYGYQLVLQ